MNDKTVVLVGAGHAHLYTILRAQDFRTRGARLLVIEPGNFWYSGLATGMLGGRYTAGDDQLDVAALAEGHGAEFVRSRVLAIDRAERRLWLEDGTSRTYEFISLNLGSCIAADAIPGMAGDETVYGVKPISRLWQLRQDLEQRRRYGDGSRLVVVGGGASGCEVAANLLALAERKQLRIQVHLVSSSERLLPGAPAAASHALERALRARGLSIHCQTRVRAREGDLLSLDGPRGEFELAAAAVVLATGLQPHPLVTETGLPADPERGLRVDSHLHSPGDARVFAGGDCAHMEGHALPKLGVFAVRQARYIHRNLLAALLGEPLQSYSPQSSYLSIINLGDGRALALRASRWWLGRASMALKHYLDQRFLRQFRQ